MPIPCQFKVQPRKCWWTAHAVEPAAKPNIIFILADDLGLGNVGIYGGPFKTPNVDKLARDGLRFTQCYSLPVCGPSRCLLLTGRYPFRTGLPDNLFRNSGMRR
ncbi:MAG: sulfatase-like hydrolase/transferase [Verrucomicrobia bacterium]|nr:sulfatase-like hydrolase/transferase [Verrucomicrobiota bacterium]